jgi:broad-specificity NMP kinase
MTMYITKDVSDRHKKLVRHFVNRLRDTSKKFMLEKFDDNVTTESFNVMLNANLQYLADVIYLLASNVESQEMSHKVLEKVQILFDTYMLDIKQRLFN